MKKTTKLRQFNEETKKKIWERDNECIFCKLGYYLPNRPNDNIFDVMHIVNKSQGGLGIEENGIIGCRYHHHLLDNGSKGLREEMIKIISNYMISLYPEWDVGKLKYRKGQEYD